MTDKVDIESFMQVINNTVDTETGIEFPGRFMASGNPVTSEGVKRDVLMSDKDMAEQWHMAIRSANESYKEERDRKASRPDAPDLTLGGGDSAPAMQGGSDIPEAADGSTLEEELQARGAKWSARCDAIQARIEKLEAQYEEASRNAAKAEAALDAIRE